MRVFLDTIVIVSAVATRGLCADILHTVVAEHQLVVGETVLSELARVLPRKLGLPPELVTELEAFLSREALVMSNAPALGIALRDRGDVAVLGEAVAGRAEALATGDRDLLEIANDAPIPILSPRGFWEQLRSDASVL